jgi:restriction system protein
VTPDEYEQHVADRLQADGWSTVVTPSVRDFGIDVLAERGRRRLGVQAKTWAQANRKINGELVMTVYGAAAYADCSESMIATDADVLPDARRVAEKLGVQLMHVPTGDAGTTPTEPTELTFGRVWREQAEPLVDTTLTRPNGETNEILSVDGAGITRRTSNGRVQRIDIEIFRWAIERVLAGVVTREQINERYTGRASSGIMLILSSMPLFEPVTLDGRRAVRRRI